MEGTIGEMKVFAGNYAPKNWKICNGELLRIQDYMTLFSVIGTNYGGDGRITFALPDLRGRALIGAGQGRGLTNRIIGDSAGKESIFVQSTSVEKATNEPIQASSANVLDNMQPFMAANWIICSEGIYPMRDY